MARLSGESDFKLIKALVQELRGAFGWTGLFSLCLNLLVLVGPLYMLQVYDRVLTSGSRETLLYMTVVAVFLLAMMGGLEAVRSRLLVRISGRIDARLGDAVFDQMILGAVQSRGAPSEPLKDLERVRTFATGGGILAFFDAPWTPLFLSIIFLFHPVLGLIALSGAVVLFTTALVSEWLTRLPLKKAGQAGLRAQWQADDGTGHAEVVTALGMLDGVRKRWREAYATSLSFQTLASERAGALTAFTKFVRPVLQVGILGAGAYLALLQEITPGIMIASSIIMGRALAPVELSIQQWRNFVAARQAYGRLREFLKTAGQEDEPMRLPRPSGEVLVERVVAPAPGGDKPILKGIGFRIPAGTSVGVIGPSAAGKSTLARLLVGVWAPSHGAVRLDSADVSQWPRDQLGPHIGYLPQDVALMDGTVAENIARFGEPEPDKVIKAAKMAGVHDMILHLPKGYDTVIGRLGVMLSAGQRQRVALARAVYGDPVLVVLDEPNSNLDAVGEEALKSCIDTLKQQGATIVVIAHRPSLLSRIDRLLVLQDGKIESYGPREEVMRKVVQGVDSGNAQPIRQGVAR